MDSSWKDWWEDIPCLFSPEQAERNCDYLTQLLGGSWLSRGTGSPGSHHHPLLRKWMSKGASSFVELNVLAEDLSLLESTPGLETVLDDLRDSERCLPTWHVIHAAALLSRGSDQEVAEFFPQTDRSYPDFRLRTPGGSLPVEAKLLMTSRAEQNFIDYATPICQRLLSEVISESGPHVTVIIKNPDECPSSDEIVDAVTAFWGVRANVPLIARKPLFNILLQRQKKTTSSARDSRACFVLAPRSDKEDIRVQGRSKKASRQLRSYAEGLHGGIFFLGLNRHQDPREVSHLLRKRFSWGQYSGISTVILSRRGVKLTPQLTHFDLFGVLHNPNAIGSTPDNIELAGLGASGKIVAGAKEDTSIPAYRVGKILAKVDGQKMSTIEFQNRLELTPELLR